MKLTGTIKDGSVQLDQRGALPEGTRVRVEPIGSGAGEAIDDKDFWRDHTIEELARQQNVKPIRSIDQVLGGWPQDELDDGFELALREWRDAERPR